MAKNYRIAVIAGDGIGNEVMPEGIRVEAAASASASASSGTISTGAASATSGTGQDDAGGRARPAADSTTPSFSARSAPRGAGSRLAVGLADPDPPRLPAVREPAAGAAARRVSSRRCAIASRATSTSSSCARISKANIRKSAVACTAAPNDEDGHAESVFTRRGTDRIMRYAFELARARASKHVTSATKSNGIIHTMPFWDERFAAIARELSRTSQTDQYHIDILTAHFVRHPDWFDVVVGSNLFGDILSDLGPAVVGSIGIAPSRQYQSGARIPVDVRAGARLGAGHRRDKASPIRSARSGRAR